MPAFAGMTAKELVRSFLAVFASFKPAMDFLAEVCGAAQLCSSIGNGVSCCAVSGTMRINGGKRDRASFHDGLKQRLVEPRSRTVTANVGCHRRPGERQITDHLDQRGPQRLG